MRRLMKQHNWTVFFENYMQCVRIINEIRHTECSEPEQARFNHSSNQGIRRI
jgi:hypothetical protein